MTEVTILVSLVGMRLREHWLETHICSQSCPRRYIASEIISISKQNIFRLHLLNEYPPGPVTV